MPVTERVAPRHLGDYLLSQGRPVVTLAEAAELMGLTPRAASDALVRLRRARLMFSPLRGLYVAIPPQYRTWGAVPALDFIAPMMNAAHRSYYVGLLSAAELHGAAHQRPQVFQVFVDRTHGDRDFERVRLRFYTKQHIDDVRTQLVNTGTGQARVSTPAATALDLASRPGDGGGLSNVATVVAELVDEAGLDVDAVVDAADGFPQSGVRRLGWLLDLVEADVDRDRLHAWLENKSVPRRPVVLLDPSGPRRGHGNTRWGLVENADVEPDL